MSISLRRKCCYDQKVHEQLVCKEVVLRNFFIFPKAQYSYPWGTTEQILMLNFMLLWFCVTEQHS